VAWILLGLCFPAADSDSEFLELCHVRRASESLDGAVEDVEQDGLPFRVQSRYEIGEDVGHSAPLNVIAIVLHDCVDEVHDVVGRSGGKGVPVVHGPVGQRSLPAAEHQRAKSFGAVQLLV
jgi:hypothetical protein